MKTLVLLLALMTSLNAYSKHNYYQENCTFESLKGDIDLYKMNYWDGRHMLITSDLPGLDHYDQVWVPGEEGSGDDVINGSEAILFSVLSDTKAVKEPYDDGCWRGFTRSFDRRVRVESSVVKIQEILNLNPGDELTMKCRYEHLEVLGDACDKL